MGGNIDFGGQAGMQPQSKTQTNKDWLSPSIQQGLIDYAKQYGGQPGTGGQAGISNKKVLDKSRQGGQWLDLSNLPQQIYNGINVNDTGTTFNQTPAAATGGNGGAWTYSTPSVNKDIGDQIGGAVSTSGGNSAWEDTLRQTGLDQYFASYLAGLNRPDQVDAAGNKLTYTIDPSGRWTQTTTLSPEQQKLLTSQNQMSQGLADTGVNMLGNIQQHYSNPLNYGGAPGIQRGQYQSNVPTSNFQSSITPYGSIQNSLGNAGDIQRSVDASGIPGLNFKADMSGVPALVGGDNLMKFQSEARDAAWNNARASLDPRWSDYSNDLESKLANQGVMQNSSAWDKAMSQMNRERAYEYGQAQNNAVSQGLTAANQLFNQGLASNQNAFQQAYNNALMGNQSSMDMFGARRAVMGDANAAQQQAFNQNLGAGQFTNQAQQQGFGQNAMNAELFNQTRNDLFNQGLNNANLYNYGQDQGYNQSMGARGQYINEQNALYESPMNIFNALRGGSQVTSPQFGGVPQISGGQGSNYMQAVQNQNMMDANSGNSMLSGLFGLGSAALTGGGSLLGGLFGKK